MRIVLLIASMLVGMLIATSTASAAPVEYGKNRPGGDFTHFALSAPDADLCRQACMGNPQCKAWTFVNPGLQGPEPMCWLKSTVPAAVTDACCVSGTKPTPPMIELNTNRPGSDYVHVVLPPPSHANECLQLCSADGACKAWTFVKAGVQGVNPVCWLKSSIPAAQPDTCCASGHK